MSTSPARRPSYREVFAVSEFRALWLSFVLSALGDRLALVALTILVYSRTKSPLLAAITFAAGFVPYLIGGLGLSGLADRWPRRTVMVACDASRALLAGVMLLPGMPLGVLIALLYMVTTIQPPFDAARSASVRDMMAADRYPLAIAVIQSTSRVVIVAGSAVGGLVVALFGAWPALAGDALTFVASGLLVACCTRFRPAAAAVRGPNAISSLGAGFRLVFGDPALRTLVGLGWLAAFYELPEGLAAPYAGRLGGGAVAAGLLIATSQLGAAVATPFFTKKIGPLTRLRWMGPMAVLFLRATRHRRDPPEPAGLDGDLRPLQHVRDVSDSREHRVRRAPAQREPGPGLRSRQLRADSRARGRVRSGRSRRRGGTSLDGHRSRRGTRCPHRLWSSTPLAANVACRRPPHGEASWPRVLADQADTSPCGSFSLVGV